jgi:flagellar protein FlaJ
MINLEDLMNMPRVSKQVINKAWIISIVLFIFLGSITLIFLYVPFFNSVGNADRIINSADPTISTEEKLSQSSKTILDFGSLDFSDSLSFTFFLGDLKITIFDILDMTLITLISVVLLPAYYYRKDNNWKEKVDEHLPNLLREISDAQKVGLPLPRAVVEASKRQYGPLTDELQLMAAKISWGIPFGASLREMQANIQTPLFDRTSILILEAEKAGGQTDEIFDSAYVHVTELLGLKRERIASMSSYKWIIIVAFLVFAFVIVILLDSFFIQLAKQSAQLKTTGSSNLNSFGGLPLHLASLQLLFFHLLIIEGFFAGLIASKMSTGHYTQGLFNSIYLLILAWFIFKLGALAA